MNADGRRSNVAVVVVTVFLFAIGALRPERLAAKAVASKAVACSAPAYREFDFWVGDWIVYDVAGADEVAHAYVTHMLNGCVVHEVYEEGPGHRGESFSIYDASQRRWQQTWMTNHGTLLTIEGNIRGGAMILSGVEHVVGGGEKQVRGVWRPVAGAVRETAVTSRDGGRTWKPWFDLIFRPHR